MRGKSIKTIQAKKKTVVIEIESAMDWEDNVKEKTEQLYGTIKDAAKWYNEFLNQDNQEE